MTDDDNTRRVWPRRTLIALTLAGALAGAGYGVAAAAAPGSSPTIVRPAVTTTPAPTAAHHNCPNM